MLTTHINPLAGITHTQKQRILKYNCGPQMEHIAENCLGMQKFA